MFGERNPVVLGALVAAGAFLLALIIQLPLWQRWRLRLLIALVVAGVAGTAVSFALDGLLPVEVPAIENNRQGTTMWETARDAGMKVQVIRVPATFPAEDVGSGHMLSGLGVPDMRGRIGTPTFYTSDPDFEGGDNQFSLELIRLSARRGRMESRIAGPINKPFYEYVVDRSVAAAPSEERSAVRARDPARTGRRRGAREDRPAVDDRGQRHPRSSCIWRDGARR